MTVSDTVINMPKCSVRLRKFDMNCVKDDKVIVVIARRNSGKSFLVRDIMYHHQSIPLGMVISPTEHANRFYADFVPDVFIHDEYSPDLIANIVKRQRMVMDQRTRMPASSSLIDPRAFLIMDDCMYDNSWITDRNVRSIFMNGRHYKLLYVLTMQFVLGIPPVLRSQIDYVFLLREPSMANQKRIFDNFGGMFPSFDVFSQIMNQTTQNFECLVIDNTSRSSRLEDQVFWYKASERPHFRLGALQYWNMSVPDTGSDYMEDLSDPSTSGGGGCGGLDQLHAHRKLPLVVVRKTDT
jgi:hypothetical protein